MSQPLLWIQEDAHSHRIYRSSKVEQRRIRRHVQPRTNKRRRNTIWLDLPKFWIYPLPPSLMSSTSMQELSIDERRSFSFFVRRTAIEWTGWADRPFWNQVVLQVASDGSKAIVRGLIALSLLHESMNEANENDCDAEKKYSLSRQQCDKAIRCAAQPGLTHFEALVSCLVVTCLQHLYNERSIKLLRAGLSLLEECSTETTAAETTIIASTIRPLFERMRQPLTDQAVALRASIQRRQQMGPRTSVSPGVIIPNRFTSLEEARSCLQDVLWFGHDCVPFTRDPLRKLMAEWQNALDASGSDPACQSSKLLLRASSLFGMLILETSTTTCSLVYDAYMSEFTTIVELIETACSNARPGHIGSFGVDGGLITILIFISTKCRDSDLRKRVVALLLLTDRRETFFSGVRHAKATTVLTHLETRHLPSNKGAYTCADIPLSARRTLTLAFAFSSLNLGRFVFVGPDGEREVVDFDLSSFDFSLRDCDDSSSWCDISKIGDLLPDAIWGTDFVQFLENEENGTYFVFRLEKFVFPIPKV